METKTCQLYSITHVAGTSQLTGWEKRDYDRFDGHMQYFNPTDVSMFCLADELQVLGGRLQKRRRCLIIS
jgi:hypothetical protein